MNNNIKLGLGFMRPDPDNIGNIQSMVDYCMSHNINYFESCRFYMDGKCESIVAKTLSKYKREDYRLCAKFALYPLPTQSADEIFKDQLNTLKTDYFDVYLLQAVCDDYIENIKKTNIIPYILEQKKLGKIKKIGFSFHGTYHCLKKMLELGIWDVVQLQLNYYDYFLSDAMYKYELVKKYNIPVYVMGSSKGGALVRNMPQSVIDIIGDDYKEYPLRFLKTLDDVDTILSGACSIKELSEHYNIISDNSKNCDINKIEKALETYKKCNYIQCTGCNYCTGCPAGINIKKVFLEYNDIIKNGIDSKYYNDHLVEMVVNNPAIECFDCGRCERKCPQHLPIRDIFKTRIFQMRF